MSEEAMLRLLQGSPVAAALLVCGWLAKRIVFPWLDVKWDEWKAQQQLNREIAAERTKTGDKLATGMHRLADKLAGGFNGRRDTDQPIKPERPSSGASPKLILLALFLFLPLLSGCGSLNQLLVQAAEDYSAAKSADTRDVAETAWRKLPSGQYVPFWDVEQKQLRYATDDDFQRAVLAAKTGK